MTQENFRDFLSAKNKHINQVSRLHYLQEMEKFLNDFYVSYNQTVNKPYSEQEQRILVRIIKLLTHQLIGTPMLRLFKGKRARRKPVDPILDRELRNQKTDKARLRFTRITRYNPISEKYKLEKEKLLRKIQTMGKE